MHGSGGEISASQCPASPVRQLCIDHLLLGSRKDKDFWRNTLNTVFKWLSALPPNSIFSWSCFPLPLLQPEFLSHLTTSFHQLQHTAAINHTDSEMCRWGANLYSVPLLKFCKGFSPEWYLHWSKQCWAILTPWCSPSAAAGRHLFPRNLLLLSTKMLFLFFNLLVMPVPLLRN